MLGIHGRNAKFMRLRERHLHHANRDVCRPLHVEGDHRAIIHLVDMVTGQHQHEFGCVGLDNVQILVDRIRGAPVPEFTELLLRRNHLHELAEFATQVAPAPLNVLDQGMGFVLRQHQDLANSGIDTIGETEIDDAILATEGCGRLGAVQGEVLQTLAAPPRHDEGHGTFRQLADETARTPRFGAAARIENAHGSVRA